MTIVTKQKGRRQSLHRQHDQATRYYQIGERKWETAVSPTIQTENRQNWITIAAILLSLMSLIWWAREPIANAFTILSDQTTVSAYLKSFGLLGPLVLAFAQLIQVLIAVIPGHVFLIAAGYVYGFPIGFFLNITYIVAASQIGFLIARRAGRPLINRLATPELVDKWQKIAEERGVLFFTIAFILPVFPTDVMNFVAGLTGMSPRKFLLANFLGRFPSAIMLTLIGSHGLQFSNTTWTIMGIIVAIIYIIGRLIINRIEKPFQ